jgi:hypothetical protein
MAVHTLLDYLRTRDASGKAAKIVDIARVENGLLEVMPFKPANEGTRHLITQTTSYPSSDYRLINKGIAATKGQEVQLYESTSERTSLATTDEKLLRINKGGMNFRMEKEKGYIKGLGKDVTYDMFYANGNTTLGAPMGLRPRLDALADDQVIAGDATGAGADQTSVYAFAPGEGQCYGIFPEGGMAGIHHEDLGLQMVADSGGTNKYPAYQSLYRWESGLAVEDPKSIARLCNIDVSALVYNGATGTNLLVKLLELQYRLRDFGGPVYYAMHRTVMEWLHQQAVQKSNLALRYEEIAGAPVLKFGKATIIRCDSILLTEAVVS